jgi:hypothetical protein
MSNVNNNVLFKKFIESDPHMHPVAKVRLTVDELKKNGNR